MCESKGPEQHRRVQTCFLVVRSLFFLASFPAFSSSPACCCTSLCVADMGHVNIHTYARRRHDAFDIHHPTNKRTGLTFDRPTRPWLTPSNGQPTRRIQTGQASSCRWLDAKRPGAPGFRSTSAASPRPAAAGLRALLHSSCARLVSAAAASATATGAEF